MPRVATRVRQNSRKHTAVIAADVAGSCASVLDDHLARLRKIGDHPNRVCHYDQLLAAHLLGFYDGAVRSLRTLDARTVSGEFVTKSLDNLRLARSTISDAMNELPAAALLPLLKQLLERMPENCSHPDYADLVTLKKRIHAIDGSYFRVPSDVLWALSHRRSNGVVGRQIRLDLHFDVLRFVPVKAHVDGKERGSEAAAFMAALESGVIYLADRNFVAYDFLRKVILLESDFVVRLKASTKITVSSTNELTDRDRDAGVLRDERVTIPGSRWAEGIVDTPLRQITVYDPVKREEVRLLTTLIDVPAHVIGRLYRQRWAIELFFRWLKCIARIKHLFNESENGITMQFYIVIIATLLMYLRLGARPSVYTVLLLSSAAAGDLCVEKVPEVLERMARERELDRLRRLKKKSI